MLSDISPVSASAAWPGSIRLCHLVCSVMCYIRPQLKSTTIFRVCRNPLCWWEICLIASMYSDSLLLGEPITQMFTSAGAQSITLYHPWLCLLTGLTLHIFWSLYTFLEVIVKRSRNQDSHLFNIHLKSIHFMLVGPLTCHQARLYKRKFETLWPVCVNPG